jgi:aminopeptidase
MSDLRVEKLADLLVNYSVKIKPGQKVSVRGSTLAEPLLKVIYKKVLQAGGFPFLTVNLPDIDELLFRNASDEQLRFIHEPAKLLLETYDAQISIIADANTKALSRIDPARMVLRSQATRGLTKTFMERSASGALQWTVALYPTQAHAQDAELSLSDYEDFVYKACMPDLDDPVGYWQQFSIRQQKVVDWLAGKQSVHLVGPGTDLRLSIAGRSFVNCDGTKNMPDGEVFTGPVEDSLNGQVLFSYPAIYNGREVTGVRLWFENGRVVKASAEKNEDYLLKILDTDEGARSVGEFAIGTNEGIDRFTGEILFDEKIGGSFHMALGAGYPETGSKNVSAIHWDMICDLRKGGEIRVDDQLFYKDGQFVVGQ